jgi:hypothetical protein
MDYASTGTLKFQILLLRSQFMSLSIESSALPIASAPPKMFSSPRNTPKRNRTCYSCGGKGHFANNVIRKSDSSIPLRESSKLRERAPSQMVHFETPDPLVNPDPPIVDHSDTVWLKKRYRLTNE